MKLVLVISVFVISSALLTGQASREEGVKAIESKLLDAPTAPYKLQASYGGGGYEFCNNSNVHVVKVRFGCVGKMNGRLTILNEGKLEEVDLAPIDRDIVSCRFWDSHDGFFPGETCEEGKLAITEAVLAEGASWKLEP